MRHGSLFSGIGGFDLAAEKMGWKNIFHCEWNEFGQKVLKYYWPKAISYENITKTDFTIHRGKIDILTGGFPCQPYSAAGKRLGKEDDRHLWPEMLRAIREIQPTWIVGENVLGLVNWNEGLVFEEVQAELEAEGYEVQPYVLPAVSVNAPHRRDRVWFVAYNSCKGWGKGNGQKTDFQGREMAELGQERNCLRNDFGTSNKAGSGFTTNTASNRRTWEGQGFEDENREQKSRKLRIMEGGFEGLCTFGNASNANSRRQSSEEYWEKESGRTSKESVSKYWENFPTQSPICNGDDGISSRLDGITFPKWRNESIKAGGNAIVPQVALQIFKAIEAYEY
jgi:DNA (cytosine-5)-methyltransferase 1